jgi:hypothetical protein
MGQKLLKPYSKTGWAWRYTPAVLVAQEAELGGSRSDNVSIRPCLKNKRKEKGQVIEHLSKHEALSPIPSTTSNGKIK